MIMTAISAYYSEINCDEMKFVTQIKKDVSRMRCVICNLTELRRYTEIFLHVKRVICSGTSRGSYAGYLARVFHRVTRIGWGPGVLY
jgi:hypothetical protein